MDLIVKSPHRAIWGRQEFRCAVGQAGFVSAEDKREGDGKTPIGRWPIRKGFYRADRLSLPQTSLLISVMQPDDAWCDIVGDPHYNQHVKLPYPNRDERLWRDDNVYDIVFMLGYNDDPIIMGKGSAIFLHLARSGYTPSAGCVTLALPDMLTFLREAHPDSAVAITPQP